MLETAVIIRDKTRLEQLIDRFNSKAQAKFYIESSGGSFQQYETEHHQFYKELDRMTLALKTIVKIKIVFRDFLPTYMFSDTELIIAIGQDGLVANTAKYLDGHFLAGVNPNPKMYDGVLLPFNSTSIVSCVKKAIKDKASFKTVSLAQAQLNDGQSLLAFNDFYIGSKTHVSSRYKIKFEDKIETQSSSGILVSTPAGATGWLSSVLNMATNVNSYFGNVSNHSEARLQLAQNELAFAVREPFSSVSTEVSLGFGVFTETQKLQIESLMPESGVIFSDGIESDFISFNTGSKLEISLAKKSVQLLVD